MNPVPLRAKVCWAVALPCSISLLVGEPVWPQVLRSLWQSAVAVPLLLAAWSAIAKRTGLLTGTRARRHTPHPELLDFASRGVFLICLLWIASICVPAAIAAWLVPLVPIYAASYLDGSEVSTHRYGRGIFPLHAPGRSRHEAPRWFRPNGWLAVYGDGLEWHGRKPSIKAHGTPPATEQQCVFGFHPHGIFPLGVQYTVGVGYCAAPREQAMPHANLYDDRRMMVAVASFCFYVPVWLWETHHANRAACPQS